jgi:hypothetical protein
MQKKVLIPVLMFFLSFNIAAQLQNPCDPWHFSSSFTRQIREIVIEKERTNLSKHVIMYVNFYYGDNPAEFTIKKYWRKRDLRKDRYYRALRIVKYEESDYCGINIYMHHKGKKDVGNELLLNEIEYTKNGMPYFLRTYNEYGLEYTREYRIEYREGVICSFSSVNEPSGTWNCALFYKTLLPEYKSGYPLEICLTGNETVEYYAGTYVFNQEGRLVRLNWSRGHDYVFTYQDQLVIVDEVYMDEHVGEIINSRYEVLLNEDGTISRLQKYNNMFPVRYDYFLMQKYCGDMHVEFPIEREEWFLLYTVNFFYNDVPYKYDYGLLPQIGSLLYFDFFESVYDIRNWRGIFF